MVSSRSPVALSRGRELNMISHGMGFNRLSRPADQRKALVRALTTEVVRHGRIRTTLVKAKAIRKYVDHMITLAKKGTLHHRRQALSFIYDKDLVASLFEQAPERYADRSGGYCRVIKVSSLPPYLFPYMHIPIIPTRSCFFQFFFFSLAIRRSWLGEVIAPRWLSSSWFKAVLPG